MASPSSSQPAFQPPPSPLVPGAWPTSSQDACDPDVSIASSPAISVSQVVNLTAAKARRRWTYAGCVSSITQPSSPATPASPDFVPLTASTSQDSTMSGLTENTLSSAASSALNTPDLAGMGSLLSGRNGSLLAVFGAGEGTRDSPNAFMDSGKAPAPRHGASALVGKQASSPHMRDCFASPYLDPPLLNMVPGLPPLRLPLQSFASHFGHHDSPPAPPSPFSETCSTPTSFSIPSPRREHPPSTLRSSGILSPSCLAADFFPEINTTPEPSPQLTIASLPTSLYVSDNDSLVLPPFESDNAGIAGSTRPVATILSPSASQMDAFALAAAVASSASRSSLSIPPSFQSASGTAATLDEPHNWDLSRPDAYRQQSCVTQASAGHRSGEVYSHGDEAYDAPGGLAVAHIDSSRARRRSAPPPTMRQSPHPITSKTISTRVDVGEEIPPRKIKPAKQPVLGKVRRIGERLRGLFRSKGSPSNKSSTNEEYALMTTTTEVTNVEYQSEHPIPIPSPRAKVLRNHRRSLPLPAVFLPSRADSLASAMAKRSSAGRPGSPSAPVESPASSLPAADPLLRNSPSTQSPNRSPHTPRPRRQRTRTAPQTVTDEEPVQGARNARRFSLSSALSKSRIDIIRSTVMPRPPLPQMPLRTSCDNSSSATPSRTGTRRSYSRAPSHDCGSVSIGNHYWGGELPSVYITRDSQEHRSAEDSPGRVRTQTAPSGPHVSSGPETVATTPKAKRSRRFSLSSMMAKRASRTRVAAGGFNGRPAVPPSPNTTHAPQYARRPRGDTVSTITQGVPFHIIQPRTALELQARPSLARVPYSNRLSLASSISSSRAASAYFDAQEQLSEHYHHPSFDADRSSSPGPESDLDSMSFARTPDYSSGTFSFGSGGSQDRYPDADNLSIPGSYTFRPNVIGKCASTSAVAQLVGQSTSTSVTKTIRFSPSLSLSFERSWSDDGDDELGRIEQEEDRGFMRALGFEFDQIARRVREETL
ncbi:hypothetical protein BV20DRAFT_935455 [Pilatotrama ljubarskyi]|nr:hypothetical protein BV20DRAFT_935455 [Pilatotrama ljubarskyi]